VLKAYEKSMGELIFGNCFQVCQRKVKGWRYLHRPILNGRSLLSYKLLLSNIKNLIPKELGVSTGKWVQYVWTKDSPILRLL